MRKKIPFLFVSLVFAVSTSNALADSLKADGFIYDTKLKILGLKDGKLQTTIYGNEKLFDLATVDWIELAGQPNFNKAEKSRKNARAAAELYKSAIRNVDDPKLQALARRRAADLKNPPPAPAPAVENPPARPAPPDPAAPPEPSASPFGNPDLFPRVRPVYSSPDAASPSELFQPIATAAEEKEFHATYDGILHDALKGSADDRAATAELLNRRAAAAADPGPKKLLLLAVYDLENRDDTPPAELAAAAQAALNALAGPSVAAAAKRIVILIDMNHFLPHDSAYAPAAIADEFFSLAELHFNAAMLKAAKQDLDNADQWSAKDPAYAARMKPRVEAFTKELQRQTDLEAKLAASPNDPDANTDKALIILARPGNAVDAAPFLAKSSKPELQRLAKALTAQPSDTAAHLAVAAAAEEALAVVPEQDQLPVAFLLESQAQSVSTDRHATDAQKARADLLLIKAEHFVRKSNIDPAAQDMPKSFRAKFFGLETQGKKIVYIIDHSGSMLDNFDVLRKEVVRSVDNLDDGQSFAVVMVSEVAEAVGAPPAAPFGAAERNNPANKRKPIKEIPKLLPATDASKKTFRADISKFRAQGQNDDLLAPFQDAFEMAIAARPDTIYFLTDGHFDPKLMQVVRKLNANKTIHINTMAFVNEEQSYAVQLRDMAKENGGTYKFVSERDLGK